MRLLALFPLLALAAAATFDRVPAPTPASADSAPEAIITAAPDARLARIRQARQASSSTSLAYPYTDPNGYWMTYYCPPNYGWFSRPYWCDWLEPILDKPIEMDGIEWFSSFSYSLYYAPTATGCIPSDSNYLDRVPMVPVHGEPPRCTTARKGGKKTKRAAPTAAPHERAEVEERQDAVGKNASPEDYRAGPGWEWSPEPKPAEPACVKRAWQLDYFIRLIGHTPSPPTCPEYLVDGKAYFDKL
jgi:hypothetical protein